MQQATTRTITIEQFQTDQARKASGGRGAKHWINLAIGELKPGEMFFVPGGEMTDTRIRMHISKWGAEYGFKMSCRVGERSGVKGHQIIRLK